MTQLKNLPQNMYNCRQEKQIIMKENTVFVNREKMLIRKQSSEESNEPLLSQGVEEKVATCTTTYNTLVSCSSSTNSNSNSSGGDNLAPITGVHSLFNTPGFSNNNQYQLPAAPAPLPVVAQPQSAITNMTAPAIEDFS